MGPGARLQQPPQDMAEGRDANVLQRRKHEAIAFAAAVQLQVPLAIQMRLRQGHRPVAVEDIFKGLAEAALDRRRNISESKCDRQSTPDVTCSRGSEYWGATG